MKREYNFIPEDDEPEMRDYEFSPSDMMDDDECPYSDIMMALMFQDKPFGIMWPKDKILEFLKARGYKLLDRKNKDTGEEYTIAVKSSSSNIPDEGHGNIKEVFDSEMEDIIMKWVLRIAAENDSAK